MDSRSEDFFLSLFLNGLKPHLGRQVSMNRPSTYEQAKQVAISVEASFQSYPREDNINNNYNNNDFNNNYNNNHRKNRYNNDKNQRYYEKNNYQEQHTNQ